MLDYMSYIDILILRYLSRTPAHGYEVQKAVTVVDGTDPAQDPLGHRCGGRIARHIGYTRVGTCRRV